MILPVYYNNFSDKIPKELEKHNGILYNDNQRYRIANVVLQAFELLRNARKNEVVEEIVLFHNTARPHMSINMMISHEVAAHTGEIKKGWTRYRDIAIKNLQTENIILS